MLLLLLSWANEIEELKLVLEDDDDGMRREQHHISAKGSAGHNKRVHDGCISMLHNEAYFDLWSLDIHPHGVCQPCKGLGILFEVTYGFVRTRIGSGEIISKALLLFMTTILTLETLEKVEM